MKAFLISVVCRRSVQLKGMLEMGETGNSSKSISLNKFSIKTFLFRPAQSKRIEFESSWRLSTPFGNSRDKCRYFPRPSPKLAPRRSEKQSNFSQEFSRKFLDSSPDAVPALGRVDCFGNRSIRKLVLAIAARWSLWAPNVIWSGP